MASKNLIPKASGEGGIGIENVTWGDAYFDSGHFNKGLYVSGVAVSTGDVGGLGGKWEDAATAGDIYYNGGNVGIGTTSLNEALHVNGNIQLNNWVRTIGDMIISADFDNNNNDSSIRFNIDGNALTNEKMRIDSDGNVGIGTTSPDQILTTRPTQAGKYGIHVIKPASNDSLGGIFVESDNTTSLHLKDRDNTTNVSTIRLKAKGDTYFNGGNVGIGTTGPDTSLSIVGEFEAANDALSSLEPISEITSKCLGTQSTTSGFGGSIDFLSSNWYSATPLPTARIAAKINSENGSNKGGSLVFSTVESAGGLPNETITKSNYAERFTIKPDGVINISNVPESASDLEVGDLYHDNGTLKIVT